MIQVSESFLSFFIDQKIILVDLYPGQQCPDLSEKKERFLVANVIPGIEDLPATRFNFNVTVVTYKDQPNTGSPHKKLILTNIAFVRAIIF